MSTLKSFPSSSEVYTQAEPKRLVLGVICCSSQNSDRIKVKEWGEKKALKKNNNNNKKLFTPFPPSSIPHPRAEFLVFLALMCQPQPGCLR
jgi:hypothetical protein